MPKSAPELLAPAGDIDSAYAAFQYGADAVYAGLRRFSARADAANFSSEELGEITAFAHAASPRRRVFAAVNTVIKNGELGELVDTLADAAECGADGLIVQDLGVAYVAKKHFPTLALHGSTQIAVHNLAGAQALRKLGFRRVTLARELSLDEVRDIAVNSGIEVEVFIHGALCYSYSGLCLYSSMLRTGSGNRGRCAYPCRDLFEPLTAADPASFPFSMKDLAIVDSVEDLCAAGVACLKIEGRKKSAAYVAATTAYYRTLLDGRSTEETRRKAESDMKTIFSRPWTKLYLSSRRNPDVVDTDIVGHRGAPIGKVSSILRLHTGPALLRFTTQRRLERHDGLQLDVPGGRPFGFSIEAIGLDDERTERFRNVFEAPAGSRVGIPLPADHPPLAAGMTVYCSSSQSVKQTYTHQRPRPGQYRFRRPIEVAIVVEPARANAAATLHPDILLREAVRSKARVEGPFDVARKTAGMEDVFRDAFSKLGDTGFRLASLTIDNPQSRFVPISVLNRLRRDLAAALETACAHERARTVASIKGLVGNPSGAGFAEHALKLSEAHTSGLAPPVKSAGGSRNRRAELHDAGSRTSSKNSLNKAPSRGGKAVRALDWSVKVAHVHALSGLHPEDWTDIYEAVVDVSHDPLPSVRTGLQKLAKVIGRDRIRLALPVITRQWELAALKEKIAALAGAGWNRWEFANLSGLTFLAATGGSRPDLASDWSVYVFNRAAALQVLELGAAGFVLSPEDDFENIRDLLTEFKEQAVVLVYQDTPLFISETCPKANAGGCVGGRRTCPDSAVDFRSSAREEVTVLSHDCRTVVINRQPLNLAGLLGPVKEAGARRVRADLSWKPGGPAQVAGLLKALRSGRSPLPGHTGNFERRLV